MPKKRFQLRVILADVNDDDEDAASVGRTYVTHAGCPNLPHSGYWLLAYVGLVCR